MGQNHQIYALLLLFCLDTKSFASRTFLLLIGLSFIYLVLTLLYCLYFNFSLQAWQLLLCFVLWWLKCGNLTWIFLSSYDFSWLSFSITLEAWRWSSKSVGVVVDLFLYFCLSCSWQNWHLTEPLWYRWGFLWHVQNYWVVGTKLSLFNLLFNRSYEYTYEP